MDDYPWPWAMELLDFVNKRRFVLRDGDSEQSPPQTTMTPEFYAEMHRQPVKSIDEMPPHIRERHRA